jgi:ribosome biogenesis SPOUT family RNA methylase Rps3
MRQFIKNKPIPILIKERPIRYVVENGKIILPDGFVEFLRKREEF